MDSLHLINASKWIEKVSRASPCTMFDKIQENIKSTFEPKSINNLGFIILLVKMQIRSNLYYYS